MSRIVDKPSTVTMGPDGRGYLVPGAFTYQRERHKITAVLDDWIMIGQWWEDPNAVGRAPGEVQFYRVQTAKGGVFELIREADDNWRLWKVYD